MGTVRPNIFIAADKYTAFKILYSPLERPSKECSQESFERTPVELNWYYTTQEISTPDSTGARQTKFQWEPNAYTRMLNDVETLRASIASQNCTFYAIDALIRLATVVKTASGTLVLAPSLPKNGVKPPRPQRRHVAAATLVDELLLNPDKQPSDHKHDAGTSTLDDVESVDPIGKYSFLSAYLIRFAYQSPGDTWEMELADFTAKFADMTNMQFGVGTPSAKWARSFETICQGCKSKFRIIVFLVICSQKITRNTGEEEIISKILNYLFVTPLEHFGMTVIRRLFECAEILEIQPYELTEMLDVPEVSSGHKQLKKVVAEARQVDWWPYARAFDDEFFREMSELHVKEIHFVCLAIIDMKKGCIDWDHLPSVAMVRDRDPLIELAANLVAAVDLSLFVFSK